LRYVCLF